MGEKVEFPKPVLITPDPGTITIFSYATDTKNLPTARYTVNVRNLRDPIGQKELRHLNGLNKLVQDFVAVDPRVRIIIEELCAIAFTVLKQGGQKYVSFGVHDHRGSHIAPSVVEMLASALRLEGYRVYPVHQAIPKEGVK